MFSTFEEYNEYYTDISCPMDDIVGLMKQRHLGEKNVHLLDIGCGQARSIDVFLKLDFPLKEVSLIEPNPFMVATWKDREFRKRGDLKVNTYVDTLEEVVRTKEIKPNSIDYMVAYHSLYHVDLKQLEEAIVGAYSWLKPTQGMHFIVFRVRVEILSFSQTKNGILLNTK